MLTATLDKATYAPGDTVTLTVVSDRRVLTTHVPVATAGEGMLVTLTIRQGVTVTDSETREWSLVSDDGVTAVFGSVA